MPEVITFGETMVVFVSEEPGEFKDVPFFSKALAGAELNVAIGLTRLGHSTKYITRLGLDPFGDYIMDFIRREKLDAASIVRDKEFLTGSYLKSKVTEGDPTVFYYRKNSAASHIGSQDIENADFTGASMLVLSGISAALSESCLKACTASIEKARKHNMKIVFDPNIRNRLWTSQETMAEVLNGLAFKSDIILPGIGEGEILTGKKSPEAIADFYLDKGLKAVVVKLGAPGAYYKTNSGEEAYIPGFRVKHVVDTVGAGDAFASGFLSGLLDGLPIRDAVVRGNASGAIIITSKTDNEILPTKEELDKFLAANCLSQVW